MFTELKTKTSKTSFEIFCARLEPPGSSTTINETYDGIRVAGCFIFMFVSIMSLFALIMGSPGFFNNDFKEMFFVMGFLVVIFIAMLIVNGKKARRKTFHALMNTETINLYDVSGVLYENFRFRETNNLRLSYEIEKNYKYENKERVCVERQLYILEIMLKSGVSYTIHIGEEQEVKKLAETLAAFLNQPIIDEGR